MTTGTLYDLYVLKIKMSVLVTAEVVVVVDGVVVAILVFVVELGLGCSFDYLSFIKKGS